LSLQSILEKNTESSPCFCIIVNVDHQIIGLTSGISDYTFCIKQEHINAETQAQYNNTIVPDRNYLLISIYNNSGHNVRLHPSLDVVWVSYSRLPSIPSISSCFVSTQPSIQRPSPRYELFTLPISLHYTHNRRQLESETNYLYSNWIKSTNAPSARFQKHFGYINNLCNHVRIYGDNIAGYTCIPAYIHYFLDIYRIALLD
jgi:hypothetical protein